MTTAPLNSISLSQRAIRSSRPKGIDLFCGCGGMSLGFEQAGFDIVAANDYDPVHCLTHLYNFPDCRTLCKSVTELSATEIRNASNLGTDDLDVLFGGSPCQGYSLIGKRQLDDPRNRLVAEFLRLVGELQPKYFVFENVPGLTLGEHRKFLDELIRGFEELGYRVETPYQVLKAKEFGVPQDRKRLFLLGSRNGERPLSYPNPTHSGFTAGASCEQLPLLPSTPSVWDALGDLPNVDDYDMLLEQDWITWESPIPSEYVKSLNGKDLTDFSYRRTWDPRRLTSSLRTLHTEESIKRFASTPVGKVEPISRFLRLSPQGLCNTLRAGTSAERGAHTSPRPIHPYHNRVITVREAARLHSYPDWFRLHSTKWHGFRQVGNSVPPLLARAVAAQVITALGVEVSKPEASRELGAEDWLECSTTKACQYYDIVNPIGQRSRSNHGKD